MNARDGNTRNEIGGDVQHGPVIQGRDISVTIVRSAPHDDIAVTGDDDPWVRLAARSEAWSCIREQADVHGFRQQSIAVARNLAAIRDQAEDALRDDPWLDNLLASRMCSRIGWLLKQRLAPTPLMLDPAEAVLLSLAPLLQYALLARSAARLRTLDPTNLAQSGSADENRGPYERYLLDRPRLVNRALLPDLRDRSNARHEIGWWLFHHWMAQRAEVVQTDVIEELLADAEMPGNELRQVLDARRVRELLYGLRLEPQVLCGREWLNGLRPKDTLFGGEPDEEHVRGPLLGLLLGVAHATAIPLADLPDTVVWHLGIPSPVDLGQLHETIANARWTTHTDGLWLSAECGHEAVVEALREQVVRVDILLQAVRRAAEDRPGLDILERLPARASAEQVGPALDTAGKPVFSGWSRFRLDEQRVRELLMGEQLYRDRNLAIRELYQNALDACRYRQARERFLDRTTNRRSGWTGLIEFEQGTDEDDRPYLECADNGVGMGEAELRGVFSQAGVRFADLTDFKDEQAAWRRLNPPIELHPNSRFGIGVLSYFMLADEITVRTCRMPRDGGRAGPVLEAVISGPGHLFQIRQCGEHGEPGTSVRLYLRNTVRRLSVVQVLRRLLAIADFTTTGRHGPEYHDWQPGVLKARQRPPWEQEGFDAYGQLVPTLGGTVIWCERGGALLVDGLVVDPSQMHGVFAYPGGFGPEGVVVNLTGNLAPRLSVDRTEVLDDVSATVEDLVVAGARELIRTTNSFPYPEWIGRMMEVNPRLADIVTHTATTERGSGVVAGRRYAPEVTGEFPQDIQLLGTVRRGAELPDPMAQLDGDPMDHILLWRLLAHRPNEILDMLVSVVPELADVPPVAPALPSDLALCANLWSGRTWNPMSECSTPNWIVSTARSTGATPREVAVRAIKLGFDIHDPMCFSEVRKPDATDSALVSYSTVDVCDRSASPNRVPAGHLLWARFSLGITVTEAADRLAHYGLDTTAVELIPEHPDEKDLLLLSRSLSGTGLWLDVSQPVPTWHLAWASTRLGRGQEEIGERLAAYGFQIELDASANRLDGLDLLLLSKFGNGEPPWLDPAEPIPPGHVLHAAVESDISPGDVVARLIARGFRWTAQLPRRVSMEAQHLLSQDLDGVQPWLKADELVPPCHFVFAYRTHSYTTELAAKRLTAFGLRVSTSGLGLYPQQRDAILLSTDLNGASPWLDPKAPVPLSHLLNAGRHLSMTVSGVTGRLQELGLDADPAAAIRTALPRVPLLE